MAIDQNRVAEALNRNVLIVLLRHRVEISCIAMEWNRTVTISSAEE